MANKDRNKRSARKARAEERAKREAQLVAQPASSSNASQAKAESKAKASKKSDKKPGFFRRIANWFGDVRTEMHKVVWPSKDELKTYTVAIIAMLVVFGVVIWLVDTGIVALIAGFTGLRG
ncbi:preprotein translocase subunit SecE [Paratractidigestivibacter faecalis]|uniref:preprotein translocase subunit SecE n=1 Tax=Paratractidigestivibacter faecalis TaxID=2292441 RepID=UPI00388D09B2